MKKLLLALMLLSPFSFADWGDVYYCQMTSHSGTDEEGKETNYNLQRFQFKVDETKNAMVFGAGGYFEGSVLPITYYHPNEEWVEMRDEYSMGAFRKGKFLYALVISSKMKTLTADCDKF